MSRPGRKIKLSLRTRTAIKPDGTRIPVVDGILPTVLQPNEDDIKHGVKGDPSHCMYVLACIRLFGSDLAFFTRGGLAYIEMRGANGQSQLVRYLVSRIAQQKIKDFDAGKIVRPEAILLSPPLGARSLGAQTALYQSRKEKASGKAWVKGENHPSKKRDRSMHDLALRDSGTGKFHFTATGSRAPLFP